jgi:hypothetical protein
VLERPEPVGMDDEFLRSICTRKGVFLRSEALPLGYDDRAIAARCRSEVWVRVRHGAYTFADSWTDLSAEARHQLVTRAVLRTARCRAVVSHTSAVAQFGTPIWDAVGGLVHITRLDGRSGRKEAGVAQHHGWMGVEDVSLVNGVLVTSATRTALDVTTITDTEHSLVMVNGLLHAQHTTLAHLERRYASMTQWPHSLRTDLVLRLADGRCESAGETRTCYVCWQQGLPVPELQFEIRQGGTLVARLDLAWPELGVWVEFDGKIKYSSAFRDGDRPEDVVFREKKREDMVRRVTGWRCVRVTWADLYNPALLAAKIRQAFRDQAAA